MITKKENNKRDGYVYGQSVRGADAEFKQWILSGDYHVDKWKDDDGNDITFKHKSRIYPKELPVNVTKPGSKKPSKKAVKVDQKQMVYYSEKYDGYYSIVTSELNMFYSFDSNSSSAGKTWK